MPQLDSYSGRFAARLFAEFPEWRAFANIKDEDDEGCLLVVKVPVPSAIQLSGTEDVLWIDSYSEITVAFDFHHTHFDGLAGLSQDEEFSRAVGFIRDIVEEKICVVIVRRGEEWRGSTTVEAGQEPDLSSFSHFDTIHIRSWKGTHNKIEERLWKPDTFVTEKLRRVLDLVREPVVEATAAKVTTARQLNELPETIEQDAAFAFLLLCNHITDSGCVLPGEAYILLGTVGQYLLEHRTPSAFEANPAMWESLKPQVEVQNA